MSIKEKFMNEMMGNQFKNMTSEEKKQMMEAMMEKFFSSMSDDEKKDMMSGMMGKMMGNNPMMGMMSMMMGRKGQQSEKGDDKGQMPWDMCSEMMTGMKETANTAKFATSELRGLFDEWCQQIEKELLDFVKEKGSIKIDEMAEKFSLSEESIKYLLSRLANKNLIDYKI
jgi:LPS O-antigen subunit length determinant protein (WzzB/FepE family)